MKALKNSLPLAVLVAGTVALTVAAGMMMFSTFMLYDDEGYMLFSLRNFAEHGRLYSEVYSQYGPLPYALYFVLHLLGVPFTHTAGRLLTLAAWVVAATFCAGIVWRATRSLAGTLACLAATFVYLWVMVSEPTHPGGLVAVLTAGMASFGYVWLSEEKDNAWAALAGLGTAALLLCKINVGIFAGISLSAMWLLHHRDHRVRRWGPWALAMGLAALPFLLMKSLLAADWVQTCAIVFAFSAIAAIGAVASTATARFGSRQIAIAAMAGTGLALAVCGAICARGTPLAEMLEGVIFGPLRHPARFRLALSWPPGITSVAIVSCGTFVLARLMNRRWSHLVGASIAWLRLVAAAGLSAAILSFPVKSPDKIALAYSAPALWLFLWPLPGEKSGEIVARAWLGLVFLGQWLHAFPVSGSQVAWGSFLAIPLATLGAWEASRWLIARRPRAPARAGVFATKLAVVVLAVVMGMRLAQASLRCLDSRPLSLPGAESLRLPDRATATYRIITLNAAAHADMLFSLPGMFSFNLWSGLPAPTLANVTHWFSLLDDRRQEDVIRALEAHPRACVIVQREHVEFLRRQGGLAPSGPLYDYVTRTFQPAFVIDDFEFRVRKERRVAPFFTAELLRRRPAADAEGPANVLDTLLRLHVLLPPGQQIAAAEIVTMDVHSAVPVVLRDPAIKVEITPITLQGDALSPPTPSPLPCVLNGTAVVSLYFDRGDCRFSLTHTLIILRDPAGAEVALLRLRP